MDLVHEVNLSVLLTELILCINEDQAHLRCDFSSSLEDCACVCLELLVVFAAYDALSDDFLLRNVLVMTFCCLGCRSDDRLRELLVLDHSLWHLNATDGTLSCLVLSPRMS